MTEDFRIKFFGISNSFIETNSKYIYHKITLANFSQGQKHPIPQTIPVRVPPRSSPRKQRSANESTNIESSPGVINGSPMQSSRSPLLVSGDAAALATSPCSREIPAAEPRPSRKLEITEAMSSAPWPERNNVRAPMLQRAPCTTAHQRDPRARELASARCCRRFHRISKQKVRS